MFGVHYGAFVFNLFLCLFQRIFRMKFSEYVICLQ
jgi:hypothetical protein